MKRAPSIRELEQRNDPKISILPTAARRAVQQPCSKQARAERARLRRESPWPKLPMAPLQRAAVANARRSQSVQRTPALMMALAFVLTADSDARARVEQMLAMTAIRGSEAARDALVMLQIHPRTFGDQADMAFAWRHIDGEGQL